MSNRGLDDEFVTALNAKDGQVVWSVKIGKVGNPDQNPNFPAARSTPTVDGALLYALGSDGDLVCLESATGTLKWKKSLRTDVAGMAPTWAYAESPLVDADVVVCVPGGNDATIVAFNKRTGDVIWKSAIPGGGMAGYASLIIDSTGGIKQYIAFMANGLVSVEAKSGKFLWRYEKTKGSMGMSILTPVAGDGLVYSGAGRVGGGAVRLKADQGGVTAEEVYFDTKLPSAIGGAVLVAGHLYGTSRNVMCVDFKTGQITWTEPSIGAASLAYADGLLFLHGENGDVALIEASPGGLQGTGTVHAAPIPPLIRTTWRSRGPTPSSPMAGSIFETWTPCGATTCREQSSGTSSTGWRRFGPCYCSVVKSRAPSEDCECPRVQRLRPEVSDPPGARQDRRQVDGSHHRHAG